MRIVWWSIFGLLLVCAPVRAQEVIARDIYVDDHLLSIDDVEFLRDAAPLSPEQTEAATMLLAGARERLATARRRQERAERKMYSIEDEEARTKEYRRYMERYVEDCATVEKEFMNDLRALLTEPQQGAWQRFERARRRLLIRNTTNLQRLDMVAILRNALNVSKDGPAVITNGELVSAIEQYEQEMDLLVQQRRPLAKALGRSTLGWAMWREEDPKADADCRAVAQRMAELNARTERAFSRFLTDAQRDAFDTRYIRAVFEGTLPRLDRHDEISDLLRTRGLSQEQKDTLRRIISEAERQLLDKCRARMTKWEQNAVAYLRQEQVSDDENFYQDHVAKAIKDVHRQVWGVLTPAQQEAYENGEDALETPREDEDKDRRPDEY